MNLKLPNKCQNNYKYKFLLNNFKNLLKNNYNLFKME